MIARHAKYSRGSVSLGFYVLTLAWALEARAADGEVTANDAAQPAPTLYVEGAAGMGSPLGWLGASAVVQPVQALAIHAGVRLASQGIHVGAGARGRYVLSKSARVDGGLSW